MEKEGSFIDRIVIARPGEALSAAVITVRSRSIEFPDHWIGYEFHVLVPAGITDLRDIERGARSRLRRDLLAIVTILDRGAIG